MNITPEKLEANRRNAEKSTGPKTENGKTVSKLNALKHGLLAQTVVVCGHKLKESTNEFKKLCQDFYTDLNPVGPLEEMLVDQIISLTWRLRRARTAESGEIALSVDGGWWQREKHNPLMDTLAFPQLCGTEGLVRKLQQSVWGCRYLIHCLSNLRFEVERDGELTEAALKQFTEQNLRGQPENLGEKLEQIRIWTAANPEKLEPEALRTRHKEKVLKCLNPEIRDAEYWLERNEKREHAEEQARQSAAVLPSAEILEKILRYETALERQLFRAMNQLERLQRRRLGENIPAPVTMDISARAQ
jgi:hypothetical protein